MNLFLKSKLIIVFFFLFSFSNIFSQIENPTFIRMPLDKGISLNLTYDIIQDNKGFIWFGTMYGLVKYDGKNFSTFKSNPEDTMSISFDDIISLFEDSKGNLWVGTWGGGLNLLNSEQQSFTRFVNNPANPNSIPDNIIWSICEDNNGIIWIGTNSQGLVRYEQASGLFREIDLDIQDSTNAIPSIHSLLIDANLLWIGYSKGLASYNLLDSEIQRFDLANESGLALRSSFVSSIFIDSNSELWIGANAGLYKYLKQENLFEKINLIKDLSINSISETPSGNLWLGTNDGLVSFNTENGDYRIFKKNNYENSVSGNYVNRILVDKSGIIWVVSYNSGVTKCLTYPPKFKTLRFDSSDFFKNPVIKTICEDQNGNIYLGSYGNKIIVLNQESGDFRTINLPDREYASVNTLSVQKNILWIGTNNSILKYDLTKKRIIQNPFSKEQNLELEGKQISTLHSDSEGNLWIGTFNQGIYNYHPDTKEMNHYSLVKNSPYNKADYILSFYSDSNNNLWVGTYGGVYVFNSITKDFISFTQEQNNVASLSNNYVYSILEDSNGDYWIGTASGLNKLNHKTNTFTHYYEKDGLPSDVIFAIVEDNNGNLWLSTNKGLCRYNPGTENYLNFDEADGLQGNIFTPSAGLLSTKGDIYFGGINGLTNFNPNKLKYSVFNPPLVITSIKVKNNNDDIFPINPNKKYFELGPDENSLFIEFASLDFANPENNRYQFKLEGYSDEWVPVNTDNSVTLSKMPHGSYTFYLKGTNSDGIWSDKLSSFSFIIHPHFWQTWWFLPSTAVGFVLLSLITYLFIVRSKVKREVNIEKIREEEIEKIRKKTAIDFHDESGHRLTRISLLTEIVKRKIGFAYTELRTLLDQISDNSASLYDGTKDFIWAIDPQKDSLYELVVRLKDFGDEIFSDTNVNFNVEGITEELQKTSLDMDWKRHLMLIFKEGINNSLKHSKCQKVSLSSIINGDEFELVLEDDGIGFDTNVKNKGNGLKNMQRIASNLNSLIQINSQLGVGTKLSFKGKFPIKSVNYN